MSPSVFQAIDEDEPIIAWDDNRRRFYNTENGQLVSNLAGIQTLTLGRVGGEPAWLDQRGRVVPDPSTLRYPGFNIQFASSDRTLRTVEIDPYERKAPKDGYYVTMAAYTDENGNLKMVTVYNKVGRQINFDDEQRRIAAAIAKQEGIPMGAKGSAAILSKATRLFHWLAR